MAPLWSKILTGFGLICLMHTAYSGAQHRVFMRLTEQEFTYLPADILIEGVLSLIITMYGITIVAGNFKEIRATTEVESKTWETWSNRPSFYIFNHRGHFLSPEYEFTSQAKQAVSEDAEIYDNDVYPPKITNVQS